MHHPVGLAAFGCSSSVEDEGLLEADAPGSFRGVDWPVSSRSFPESSSCDPVRPRAVLVFSVPWAVEVPFLLSSDGRKTFGKKISSK